MEYQYEPKYLKDEMIIKLNQAEPHLLGSGPALTFANNRLPQEEYLKNFAIDMLHYFGRPYPGMLEPLTIAEPQLICEMIAAGLRFEGAEEYWQEYRIEEKQLAEA